MSKIIRAVNVMISHDDLITDATQGYLNTEIFFLYDEKYKWSLVKGSDGQIVSLNYYPQDIPLSVLASFSDDDWSNNNDYVTYIPKDLGGREAKESMAELFRVVSEKLYGMDDVLNDIIESAIPF
tara:strand:- start:2061 stop:2435 length:375 start_codon:yes stop_codon:yes gene_type:complete